LQNPSQQLFVSYPTHSVDNVENKPSIIVKELQKIYLDDNLENIKPQKKSDRNKIRSEMTETQLAEDYAKSLCCSKKTNG
jgi:hypothetical protein